MASRKAISVKISPKDQALIRQQIGSGSYESESKVVSDALRLIREREALFDAWLRQEVKASFADETPPSPIDAVFKRLHGKIDRTVKAAKLARKVVVRR